MAAGVVAVTVTLAWFWTRQPPPTQTELAVVPLTTYPGREIRPSFNPEGSAVAFVWDGER